MEQVTIKSIDLVSMVVAAEIWFKKMNEKFHTFELEEKKATELKKQLYKTNWEEDAELRIEENLPF